MPERRYNYGRELHYEAKPIKKVCARCQETFIILTKVKHHKYCPPCKPLAERERHKKCEEARRLKAQEHGWPRCSNYKKPKLIRYAGYDGRD